MGSATSPTPTVRPPTRPSEPLLEGVDGAQVIAGSHCPACATRAYPASQTCPACLAAMELTELGPRGTIYSYTTVHTGADAPYTLAYIDLEDGPRLLAKIDGIVTLDAPVTAIGMSGEALVFAANR